MSSRQLEQLRETLDSIVEDLCNREQAVDEEQAHLLERLNQLDQRQTELKSLEELISSHQATELELAEQLQGLIKSLDERAAAQPAWITSALETLETRLLDRLAAQLPQSVPSLAETVGELEKVQTRSLGKLTEQLTASLQTAIAVQLAPLSDDLPAQLESAVAQALPNGSTPLTLSMPELAREIEKFESKSMASMAARMAAGLQTTLQSTLESTLESTLSSQLSSQWSSLVDQLPSLIARAVSNANSPGADGPKSDSTSSGNSNAAQAARIDQLTQQVADLQSSLKETEALLAESLEHPYLPDGARRDAADTNPADDALLEALRTEVNDLRSLLTAKERDSAIVEELREEIQRLRSGNPDAPNPAQDEQLRERLELASCEIIDLRSQNEELSERIAKLQISYAPHGHMPHLGQEGLCWEERKRLLLEQLNAECDDVLTPEAQQQRLTIEEVIKTTEAELARRDREIAELRSLLEQQSAAREGLAVGAAAVAQLIESDELVQAEREKLRALQKSWDEKLRQTEIDLSMERAKLARERLQLEEQKQELEDALHAAHAEADAKDKTTDPKGRKWLSRLGLKEDK